jgi:hypothetical protein
MTPTPSQIAELKAAGYYASGPHRAGCTWYIMHDSDGLAHFAAEDEPKAWSAAWSHYQSQRGKS